MINNLSIVIQAGGKGRRLQKYTKNCPKSLVSVSNSTLLEKNLDTLYNQFFDSKYYIIADEKSQVVENYFLSYPHNAKPYIIKPIEKGTLSGLKAAVELSNNGPILFVWCDLLLDSMDLHNLAAMMSDKNIIGLSKTFDCRWSFSTSNTLVEISSNQRGVAGLFYFPNLSSISTQIPLSGEFVKWLSTLHEYEPDVFFLEKTSELGDIKTYEDNYIYKKSRERFFNKITFDGDFVRKECIVKEYASLIKNEAAWYNYASQKGYEFIPGIYSENPLTIDNIDGVHPDQMPSSERIIVSCINALKSLHSIENRPFVESDIIETYITKTCARVEKVRSLLPLEKDNVEINGKIYSNPFHSSNYDSFIGIVSSVLNETSIPFAPIHGDPTFSNIIYSSEKNKVFLIDPRGKFGGSLIFGDPYYDFAKLLYSTQGSYDAFNRKDFELTCFNDSEFYLALPNSGYSKYNHLIYNSVDSRPRLDLIHSLIWFSLAGYVKDHIDSIVGSFLKGVLTFHDFKENILELSPLPKTWLFDVDGTLVKHNSHISGDVCDNTFLPGVSKLLERLSQDDTVVLLSARDSHDLDSIVQLLRDLRPSINIKILDSLGVGERILINDSKPSGLKTAFSLNCERDKGLDNVFVVINPGL